MPWGPVIETGFQKTQQLYHLKNDPNEQDNLASKHPEIVKDLKEKLSNLKKDGF